MTDDLERTVAAVVARGWRVMLCRPRSKQPAADAHGHWRVSGDADTIRSHVARRGNVGLIAGRSATLALLDPDDLDEWARLVRALGAPGKAWVRTGSGKMHYYVRWEPGLPAKLRALDGGRVIGEMMRGGAHGYGQQHCLLPPSLHPDTGEPYRWLVDPVAEPIEPLPEPWRRFFRADSSRLRPRPLGHAPQDSAHRDPRLGLDVPVLVALLPPGWSRRGSGNLKFACRSAAPMGTTATATTPSSSSMAGSDAPGRGRTPLKGPDIGVPSRDC